MALRIKNAEVERLAAEVAELAHESKTEAIRRALEELQMRLRLYAVASNRADRAFVHLEREVWPFLPGEVRGKSLTKAEEEEILGYGPEGV
jgi:antitoxin VapB